MKLHFDAPLDYKVSTHFFTGKENQSISRADRRSLPPEEPAVLFKNVD